MDSQLTPETMKVLSSDSRRKMLKSLNQRRKTVSELATEFELSKSTVHEHLSKLVQENLITKKENGNKWVYYELTSGGKDLLGENGKKIILLLSSIVFGILGAFSLMYSTSLKVSQQGIGTLASSVPTIPLIKPASGAGTESALDITSAGESVIQNGSDVLVDISVGGEVAGSEAGAEIVSEPVKEATQEMTREFITDEISTQAVQSLQTGIDSFLIMGILLIVISIVLFLTWLKSR